MARSNFQGATGYGLQTVIELSILDFALSSALTPFGQGWSFLAVRVLQRRKNHIVIEV